MSFDRRLLDSRDIRFNRTDRTFNCKTIPEDI